MITAQDKFEKAIAAFDAYNTHDPHQEGFNGKTFPKEILYAQRMTERLARFAPHANEPVRLAAHCQHIGRWEIARHQYAMNKIGYLKWRNEEKLHHAKIAQGILLNCGYDQETIERVKFLVLKKELHTNADTQLLEDVVCLVFIEFYLDDFAAKHDDEKVVAIIRKTLKKMSPAAIAATSQISVSTKIQSLIQLATSPARLFKFEEEFMEGGIRCIPMMVRFKLDACGIKLKLPDWNKLTLPERTHLATAPSKTEEEIFNYRKHLQQLVLGRTGKEATDLPVERNPPWAMLDNLPDALQEKLKEYNWNISLKHWKALIDLQRFVLIKLSRPSHENKNFAKAMKEFGLESPTDKNP
jgi:hypothetical protein